MGLIRGMSALNTRKRKPKITKAKYKELELQWREHNRRMKSKGLHEFKYDTLEEYIEYCYGRVKIEKKFTPYKPESSWRRNEPKYPSAPLTSPDGKGTKKETLYYTGTLIKGIATMHKSNAVPIMNKEQATEISRMAK